MYKDTRGRYRNATNLRARQLRLSGFSRFRGPYILSSVFVFFKTWLTESSLAPSHVPSVERRRAGPAMVSKDRENALEIRSRRLYCQWENDYPKIIPLLLSLFIVIPRRYVRATLLESSSWISRSITEGFWGESRLPVMRPKYGVRIPERSHTQRLPQIAVLRDIFSSSFAAIDSSVEHGKRSSRDIIRTTGIFLESNLNSLFFIIWIINLHSWTFLCQKFDARYIWTFNKKIH